MSGPANPWIGYSVAPAMERVKEPKRAVRINTLGPRIPANRMASIIRMGRWAQFAAPAQHGRWWHLAGSAYLICVTAATRWRPAMTPAMPRLCGKLTRCLSCSRPSVISLRWAA